MKLRLEVANWSLSGRIPTIGFYRALHLYLKQHFKATKTSVGKLYCAIDVNLKEKESRPDNIYQFVKSDRLPFRRIDAIRCPTCKKYVYTFEDVF